MPSFILLIAELKQRRSTHVNRKWDLFLSQYAMKPKFLLVQLSAFSLIERFAREFGLDAIILLRRILPKGSKSTLSVDVRPAQNVFAQAHYY